MKAAIIEAPGLENLRLRDLPEPRPGPNDVLVRLRAASLNYRDLLIVDGGYGSAQRTHNLIPLSGGAGEIAEIGSEVTIWQPGDRVVGALFPLWRSGRPTEARLRPSLGSMLDGVAVEYRVFPANAVLPIPPHLNFVEAATLP